MDLGSSLCSDVGQERAPRALQLVQELEGLRDLLQANKHLILHVVHLAREGRRGGGGEGRRGGGGEGRRGGGEEGGRGGGEEGRRGGGEEGRRGGGEEGRRGGGEEGRRGGGEEGRRGGGEEGEGRRGECSFVTAISNLHAVYIKSRFTLRARVQDIHVIAYDLNLLVQFIHLNDIKVLHVAVVKDTYLHVFIG